MGTLSELWTTERVWVVPEGWRQGRGAWGGLVTGQVVTAASVNLPDPRLTPRNLWVAMLGPVPAGEVECRVTDLRVGRSTLARQVELVSSAGDLLTRATVEFGAPRAQTVVSDPPAQPPDPAPTPAQWVALGPPLAPEFTPRLRFAPAVGFPFSGGTELVTAGWISLADEDDEELSPAVIAALADAWWTTSIVGLGFDPGAGAPPPVATLDFVLSFPQAPLPEPDIWRTGLWHTGRVLGGQQGYLTEVRTLHSPAGRLLAVNTQLQTVGRAGD